jgi:hypothetical protein
VDSLGRVAAGRWSQSYAEENSLTIFSPWQMRLFNLNIARMKSGSFPLPLVVVFLSYCPNRHSNLKPK